MSEDMKDFCGDKIEVYKSGPDRVRDPQTMGYKVTAETKFWGPIPEFELEGE